MITNRFWSLCLLFFPFCLSAQSPWSATLEVGGYARFWALGVERTLAQPADWEIDLRMGVGAQAQRIYLPGRLQASRQWGSHGIPLHVGATLLQDRTKAQNPDTFLLLGAGIGYRYRPAAFPLWVQLGYVQLLSTDPTATQLIDPEPEWLPSLELSIGLRLGK